MSEKVLLSGVCTPLCVHISLCIPVCIWCVALREGLHYVYV